MFFLHKATVHSPSAWVGAYESFLPPCSNTDCLDIVKALYRQPQLSRSSVCSLFLLCVEDTALLCSYAVSGFHNPSAPFPQWFQRLEEVYHISVSQRLAIPKSPIICTLTNCEFCHLLEHKEISLMKSDSCTKI